VPYHTPSRFDPAMNEVWRLAMNIAKLPARLRGK
jgi:hypothetical protein